MLEMQYGTEQNRGNPETPGESRTWGNPETHGESWTGGNPETQSTYRGGLHEVRQDSHFARYYTGIDWMAILFHLLEKIHWILLAAFAGAIAAGIYVSMYVTPIYQAESKIYIVGSETTISLTDLQLGSSLARDYQEIFKIFDRKR